MRLVRFTINGFRRFEEACDVYLDGHVIAITGPNEAGKSSLLDAIEHLNHEGALSPSELTRRTTIPANQRIIRARYLVERDDLAKVRQLNGGVRIRWFILTKTSDGTLRTGVEPELERDFTPRDRARRALERFRSRLERVSPITEEEKASEEERLFRERLDEVIVYMGSLEPRLAANELELFGGFLESLRQIAETHGQTGTRALVAAEAAFEADQTHPNDEARRILGEGRPEILRFEDAERTLASQYDVIDEVPSLPPTAALRNLASLADLDLEAIRTALDEDDRGLIDTLVRQANERLLERFRVSWRQSDVTVRFRTDDRILRILIESPHEPASQISERSDGMRAFIALLAYMAVKSAGIHPPILLVDEAETHLHYAAQADLVKVFTEQTAASQVVYTTHSAGCLPEDLGTGVRIVVPLEGPDRSTVANSFWDDEPGFTPLLRGMGIAASAFAFTPARFVVFAEGATELILLPTLFREATGRHALDFQIAPGLALVSRQTASTLELEAAQVQYVVDSDAGGRAIKRVLRRGGVAEEDILELRAANERGLSIEDFVDAETYRRAVNEELRRSHGQGYELTRGDIPAKGRPSAVRAWCGAHGIGEPNKVNVARHIVEMRGQRHLVARRQALVRAYDYLRRRLRIDELSSLSS